MREAVRLGWRVAAVVAFGATAALAVTLSRGAPLHASLTSERHVSAARSHHADHARHCVTSGVRISAGAGKSTARDTSSRAGTARLTVVRSPRGFTTVSGVACAPGGHTVTTSIQVVVGGRTAHVT
jgi:hypothetical protein